MLGSLIQHLLLRPPPLQVVEHARLDSIMRLMEDEAEQQRGELSWWRRKMAWMTSWTGAGGRGGKSIAWGSTHACVRDQ